MKRIIHLLTIALGLLCFTSTEATAQYTAVGLRLGQPVSLSFKTFLSESSSVEAFVGYRSWSSTRSWTNVGGLYQVHKPFDVVEIEGLSYYFGVGASAYFWSFDNDFERALFNNTTFGVHINAGFDYAFENTPINVSLDWLPTYTVGGGYITGFVGRYGAISLRYIIGRK